jgi:hypothetical protein
LVPKPYTLGGPFLDTHIIAHLAPDIVAYEESTILPFLNKALRIELATSYIYYVHHLNNTIGSQNHLTQLNNILYNLYIHHAHIQNASQTWKAMESNRFSHVFR